MCIVWLFFFHLGEVFKVHPPYNYVHFITFCWICFRNIPIFSYLLISWRTSKLFPLLGCYEQWCWEHLCMRFCVNKFSVLLGIYPGTELLHHTVTMFMRLCQTILQSGYTIFHSQQQCLRVPISLYYQHLLPVFFIITIPVGIKWYPIAIYLLFFRYLFN